MVLFSPEMLYYTAILLLLAHCAWTDITTFKIRNNSVLAILAVVIVFWITGMREFQPVDLVLAAAIFAASLGLWLLGKMGGGDVKLLAATVLALGSQPAMIFGVGLLACALLWLGLLRYWLVVDYYIPFPAQLERAMATRRVPYGVCIALAAMVAVLGTLLLNPA